ncbi:MAG: hypothetical protein MN733_39870 [Nitrososphaera sp.]|nr:hypothetical protein [Nitrososphaera sp.]
MTISEFRAALAKYPADAKLVVGINIPELYINTHANLSVSGNTVNPDECTLVQLLATAPPVERRRLKDIGLGVTTTDENS